MEKKKGQKIIAFFLLFVLVFLLFQGTQLITKAANEMDFKTVKNADDEYYYLYHNKWTSSGGVTTEKSSVKAKLHSVGGTYAYCIHMQDGTNTGPSKTFQPEDDSRTQWLTKKTGGYTRAEYCGIAHAYLVKKSVSLDGISNETKLFNLTLTERKLLSQAFVWYMQFAGYNRKEGSYAMAIKGISGWTANAQYKLFDQIYESAKSVLPYTKTTKTCYKLTTDGDTYQPMMIITSTTTYPKYDSVTYSDQGSAYQDVNIQITKKDRETEEVLPKAKFQFICDGVSVGIATTEADGIAFLSHARTLTTEKYSAEKQYVTNYSSLTAEAKNIVTKNGYYKDKDAALSAAQAEVDEKVTAELNALKSKTHVWTIKELEAPPGYQMIGACTVTEPATLKEIYLNCYNAVDYRKIVLNKSSSQEDIGAEATLKNAEYGLFAAETIQKPNGEVLCHEGDQVATLRTDASGNASADGIYPGKYYLKEVVAPTGFLIDTSLKDVDLTQKDQSVEVQDTLILGKIRIKKLYETSSGGSPEADAQFEIYDSEGALVQTITTQADGVATSGELPYGSYRLHQIKGMSGYQLIPDVWIKIDGSSDCYDIQRTDKKECGDLSITKYYSISDQETGVYLKQAEEGAEFEVRKDNVVVATMVTDQNGYAEINDLEPGTYTLHQTKGKDNFQLSEDTLVTIEEGVTTTKNLTLVNESMIKKVRLKKTKSKNEQKEPEAEAIFAILKENSVDTLKMEQLSTAEKRKDYVNALPKEAVIAEIKTDELGEGVTLLQNLPSDQEFVVLQTAGAEGYTLAEPYYSKEHKPTMEGTTPVYIIEMDDPIENWGKIQIKKKLVTGRTLEKISTEPEENAVFQLKDAKGNIIEEKLVTDKDGVAITKQLEYGVYYLEQLSGSEIHEKIQTQRIEISEANKQQTIEIDLIDEEKPVIFELKKMSALTGVLLNDAIYEIYDINGNLAATLMTGMEGADGIASCELPFGEYTLKEVKAPDGYRRNETKTILLDLNTIRVKEGQGNYCIKEKDEPFYGTITLSKTGMGLSKFQDGKFQYESQALSGAEYTLYAKQDIYLDDGTLFWAKDEVIDKQVTDAEGTISFGYKEEDGTETKKFPLGEYYVQETKAPDGYVLDETIYDVILSKENVTENQETTDSDVDYQLNLSDALQTFQIRFYKTDEKKNPLEGAEFGLYADTEIVNDKGEVLFHAGDLVSKATSEIPEGESEAIVIFSELPSNLYRKDQEESGNMFTVKELAAPFGYQKTEETMSFDMDPTTFENEPTLIYFAKDMVNEEMKASLQVVKTDEYEIPMQGVEFTLFDENEQEIAAKTTDAEGKISFIDLPKGQYVLKETKTLPGKTLLSKEIQVSLPVVMSEEETKMQHAETEKAIENEGKYYFYDVTYNIKNQSVLTLPETGGKKSRNLLIFGVCLIGMGVCLSVFRRRI